ncbi:hypothetical protein [Deinococcus aerius]|uniref:hypothetical protein n=1 Tax=Deinococcus aerius TaxID=200253 RepID=UPI0010573EEE|nr:hypothetical protein [Deinococcus aerius]
MDRTLSSLFNFVGGLLNGYSKQGNVKLESTTISKVANGYMSRTLFDVELPSKQRVHVVARSYLFGNRTVAMIYPDTTPNNNDDSRLAEAIMETLTSP